MRGEREISSPSRSRRSRAPSSSLEVPAVAAEGPDQAGGVVQEAEADAHELGLRVQRQRGGRSFPVRNLRSRQGQSAARSVRRHGEVPRPPSRDFLVPFIAPSSPAGNIPSLRDPRWRGVVRSPAPSAVGPTDPHQEDEHPCDPPLPPAAWPAARGVTIYPFGGDRLAVEVDGRPGLVKQLTALPGVGLWQDGDGEKTFLFDVARFEAVAAVVRPRKRRRLPEGQRRACTRRLARARPPVPT